MHQHNRSHPIALHNKDNHPVDCGRSAFARAHTNTERHGNLARSFKFMLRHGHESPPAHIGQPLSGAEGVADFGDRTGL